ncbi:hypothetical protein [Pectobacterium actinidiae]|uniref:hypothetical protein n=1 Tax=Pectobacterium actinidiae TaxID=1507808 RepID=UPI00380FAC66
MVLKHIKLSELDESLEFKMDDEVEDFEDEEKDDQSKGADESEKARRKAYIEYQNTRKKKLEKIGKHHIQIRLDVETFEKLSDLCEVLGYTRPKPFMNNLIEMYSAIFKYLLRTSEESFEYNPKKKLSIEKMKIYKYVDHLRYEQKLSKDDIISNLQKKDIKIPLGKTTDNRITFSGKENFLERFFEKDKIIKVLKMIDDKE